MDIDGDKVSILCGEESNCSKDRLVPVWGSVCFTSGSVQYV